MTPYLNWDISPALQPHKTSIPTHFVSRALNFLHIKSFQIEFYQFCLSELLKSSSYFKNVSLYYLIVLGNCHLFIHCILGHQSADFKLPVFWICPVCETVIHRYACVAIVKIFFFFCWILKCIITHVSCLRTLILAWVSYPHRCCNVW